MIYYLNPVNRDIPVGGVKKIYDHVRLLQESGLDAAVLQAREGFLPTWFRTQGTRVAYAPIQVLPSDLLVVPEVFGARLKRIAPGIPRVSLNQNVHLSFFDLDECHPYVGTPGLLGALVVSQHTERLLRSAFPELPLWRFVVSVDPGRFSSSARTKRRMLCYMPRKRPQDAKCVLGILSARNALRGWDVQAIDDLKEDEVSELLSEAAIFLSFSEQEGFSLPPLEAMASGALVIGYAGFGAEEFFTTETGLPVPDGDVETFAHTVEQVLSSWDERLEHWNAIRDKARQVVEQRYSSSQERESLLRAFEEILELAAATDSKPQTISRHDISHAKDPVHGRLELRRHAFEALRAAKRLLSSNVAR